jgi:hypothetical protein
MTATGSTTNLRPLGIGEILDAALTVYRKNFKTLFLAVLMVVLPLTILSTLITASTSENAFNYTETTTVEDQGSFIAGTIVTSLISLLSFGLSTAACFHAVIRGYLADGTTWQESIRFGLRKAFPVIVLLILFGLGLIPMFILLIIPGIWLTVRWSVAVPALLAEELSPPAALGRSFKLVGGRWWATFGALLAMYILVVILQLIVGVLMGALFATAENEVLIAAVYTLFSALASAITLPVLAATVTILYYDLRVRKEGYDLQLAAGGMGGGSAPVPFGGDGASQGTFGSPAPAAFGSQSPAPSGGFSPPAAPGEPAGPSGFGPPAPPSAPPPAPQRDPEAPGGGAAPTQQ